MVSIQTVFVIETVKNFHRMVGSDSFAKEFLNWKLNGKREIKTMVNRQKQKEPGGNRNT